jgi:hypothetical protein
MAYIGKSPIIGNFVKLDAITAVNGQAAYTMQNGGSNFTDYESVNQFLVSLNGTIQAPTDSFTVSGSTLTFASNLATGDVIDFIMVFGNSLSAGTPTDATVSTAKIVNDAVTAAKINDDIISGATELASEPADTDEFLVSDAGTLKRIDYSLIKGGGITMVDQFRLTADFTSNGDLTANLERVDDASYGSIGTGMTESSGVFTFPSTGIYLVQLQASMLSGTNDNVKIYTYVSTNGGSNYDLVMEAYAGSSDQENTGYGSALIDVTNTSNVKVKFTSTSLGSGAAVLGSTDHNSTSFLFMRLGDT